MEYGGSFRNHSSIDKQYCEERVITNYDSGQIYKVVDMLVGQLFPINALLSWQLELRRVTYRIPFRIALQNDTHLLEVLLVLQNMNMRFDILQDLIVALEPLGGSPPSHEWTKCRPLFSCSLIVTLQLTLDSLAQFFRN